MSGFFITMKPIEGYESYLVSENGDVWSTKRGRFLTKSYNKGYEKIIIKVDGVYHNKLVHRLVGLAFIPNPENKPQINHKDGNKSNNHVSNLEWCTQSENNKHAFENGLMAITDKCIANQKESVGIKVINTVTGKIYGSIRIAAIENKINHSSLCYKLKGLKFNNTNLKYLTK